MNVRPWLRKLAAQVSPPKSRRAKPRWSRPRLEALEGWAVPAVVRWALGANGDFAVAGNWTVEGTSPAVHRVPGPADDAIIPQQYVVTSSDN